VISFLAGLPDETNDDKRMKRIFATIATSCQHAELHVAAPLRRETGWHAIVLAMKSINVYGMYRPNTPPNPVLDFHPEGALPGYLARARGRTRGFQVHQAGRARPVTRRARSTRNMTYRSIRTSSFRRASRRSIAATGFDGTTFAAAGSLPA